MEKQFNPLEYLATFLIQGVSFMYYWGPSIIILGFIVLLALVWKNKIEYEKVTGRSDSFVPAVCHTLSTPLRSIVHSRFTEIPRYRGRDITEFK